MEAILLIVYIFCGDMANRFLKYHVFNVRAEYTSDMKNYIIQRACLGAVLGWISIPIAIVLKIFGVGKSGE